MPGEESSNKLLVQVNGSPLAAELQSMLTSGYVDDSTNVPDLFVLRFRGDAAKILDKSAFTIGAKVKLSVQASGPGGPMTLMSGEVTALETEVGVDGVHTVVRGLDQSHRLFRGLRVEAYVQATAADIARKIAQRAGLQAGKIDSTSIVMPHVAQDGISDWAMLRRLAEQVGAEVAVVDGALNFCKPTDAAVAPSGQASARDDALTIEQGVNLVSLRATVTSAEQIPEVEVRGWNVTNKKPVVAVAPAKTRSAKLADLDPARLAQTFPSPRWIEAVSSYSTQKECENTAQALAERIAGGFAELDGVVRGNPKVRAGVAVALSKVGKPFDGRYTVSSTRHDFSPDSGYLTSFTVSNASERSLYGVANGAGSHAESMSGVITATVTDVKDPDSLGRVKVTFPVMSGDYVSWWCRAVQVGAGKGRGTVWLPEVGDEVLVAFGMGSFAEPYVLGGLYNGVDQPMVSWKDHVGPNDGSITRRAFVSRTGMVVEMFETAQDEKLTISTNSGAQRITLTQKANKAIEIISEGPVTIIGKQDIKVTSSGGDVAVKGKKVTVEATGDLELSGTNVKVTAKANADIKGLSAKVSGDTTAELSGGATATVKGALVRIN